MDRAGKIVSSVFYSSPSIPKLVSRLHANGGVDTGFGAAGYINSTNKVLQFAFQNDGKIVGIGDFTNVIRLTSDGIVDPTFDPGTGPNNTLTAVAIQLDGKILLAGGFTNFNGVARSGIARLNSDGSINMTFDPGLGPNLPINTIAIAPDGGILLEGCSHVNGLPRNRIARLNSDSPTSPAFVTNSGDQTIAAGRRLPLFATVAGGLPMSFQWKHAGTNLLGGTNSTFELTDMPLTNAESIRLKPAIALAVQ